VKAARERAYTTIDGARRAASTCRACELWRRATQTVFGEGAPAPRIVIVGEQPGDQEDRQGRPFVGPSGRLLDAALERAGIARQEIWVTNAVKHFKWTPSGKRRIHARPSAREIAACRPWLETELELLAPELVICLGATAARALLGPAFRLSAQRGRIARAGGHRVFPTVHPSALLRAPDSRTREREIERFVADLRRARRLAGGARRRSARRGVA
jgi:DNA polymerase